MICPKCNSSNVHIDSQVYTQSVNRSCLWNLLMILITGGLWIIWMLVRKRKEKTIKQTSCTCQNCGYSWVMKNTEL